MNSYLWYLFTTSLIASFLIGCKSSSSYTDRSSGLRVEERGMSQYNYGSGATAFHASHDSQIGPCFVSDMKAYQANQKAHENDPDEWSLNYTSDIKGVSPSTIRSWNSNHLFRAHLDEDSLANLSISKKLTDPNYTKVNLLKDFSKEVAQFRRFLIKHE